MPAAVIADTVFAPSSTVSKMPSSVAMRSGRRSSLTVISVTMPMVPSEPTKKPVRS